MNTDYTTIILSVRRQTLIHLHTQLVVLHRTVVSGVCFNRIASKASSMPEDSWQIYHFRSVFCISLSRWWTAAALKGPAGQQVLHCQSVSQTKFDSALGFIFHLQKQTNRLSAQKVLQHFSVIGRLTGQIPSCYKTSHLHRRFTRAIRAYSTCRRRFLLSYRSIFFLYY